MTCPNCTNPECDGLCVGGSRSVPEQKPTNQTTMTTALLTRALEALDWCADLSQTTLNHTSLHETRAAIRAHLEAQPEPEPVEYQILILGQRWTKCSKHIYDSAPDRSTVRALYDHAAASLAHRTIAALKAHLEAQRQAPCNAEICEQGCALPGDCLGRPAQPEPVAWLHDVVSGDGEIDQALSFAPDNFPLDGVGGFCSVNVEPLFLRAAPTQPAVGQVPDGRILPHPGSREASDRLDAILAEYNYPTNNKNAARAGWEAANRWLAAAPTQPAPHPPSRHCMCDACKPSFVDDTQPAVAQAVGEVDAVREGGEFHVAFSYSLPLGTKLYTAAPAQPAPQALTDDQVESLIDESDGRWHDGEFRIDGPDLTRLLRAAHGITAPKGDA